jgi:hypothetical protein
MMIGDAISMPYLQYKDDALSQAMTTFNILHHVGSIFFPGEFVLVCEKFSLNKRKQISFLGYLFARLRNKRLKEFSNTI